MIKGSFKLQPNLYEKYQADQTMYVYVGVEVPGGEKEMLPKGVRIVTLA